MFVYIQDGSYTLGKVSPSHGAMFYPYDKKEQIVTKFLVLANVFPRPCGRGRLG